MKRWQRIATAAIVVLFGASAFTAANAVAMMPAASGAYVLADAGADALQSGLTVRDEKQPAQPLEKGKPTGSESKSDWEIRVQPAQPPDNVKSLPERNDDNKQTPPDRF